MRKLKGVMINGEWLGERVAINSVFRAICNISPSIMLEFVHLINNMDGDFTPLTITSFEFSNSDGIRINFSNSIYKGSADLVFSLKNQQLFLQSSVLDLQPISVQQSFENNSVLSEPIITSAESSIDDKSLISEKLLNEFAQTEKTESDLQIQAQKNKPKIIEEIPAVKELYESNEELLLEQKEVLKEDKVLSQEDNECIEVVQDKEIQSENIIDAKKDELIKKVFEDTSSVEAPKPIVIEVVQAPVQPALQQVIEPAVREKQEITSKISEVEIQPENLVCKVGKNDVKEGKIQNEFEVFDSEKSMEDFETLKEEPFNTVVKEEDSFMVDFDSASSEIKTESETFAEHDFVADLSELRAEIESKIEASDVIIEEEFVEGKMPVSEVSEILASELEDEVAEACLLDLYSDITSVDEDAESVQLSASPESFMMQAVLAEMVALKEELDVLKSEPAKKITAEEFFGGTDNSVSVKDEDADFKIWSSTDKINAAILDEECFIAGEKLYRWGETLYLED